MLPSPRLLRLAFRIGLTERLARRSLARGRFVLMFHGISSHKRSELPRESQPYVDSSDLGRVLDWLSARTEILTSHEFLQGDRAGVLLTFDDGYANNHTRALPLLEEARAPAIFFVTTQHVIEPRNWLPSIRRAVRSVWKEPTDVPDDIARDLFDGMSPSQLKHCAGRETIEIGAHSVSHPNLTTLDDEKLDHELRDAKRQLTEWVQRPIRLFAYPAGDYDKRVVAATKRAGYQAAFAEDDRGLAEDPTYEIPRLGLYCSDEWYLAAKLSGLHRRPLPVTSRP